MDDATTDDHSEAEADAIQILIADHRSIDEVFETYETLPSMIGADRRRELVAQIVRDLSAHAAIEEEVFYPAVREALPDGDRLAGEGEREHGRVKGLLAQLDGREPDAAGYDQLVLQLIDDVRQHVEEEERDILPQLRDSLGPDRLRDLAERMLAVKRAAPDRPLPYPETAPPGQVIAGHFPDISPDVSEGEAEESMQESPEDDR